MEHLTAEGDLHARIFGDARCLEHVVEHFGSDFGRGPAELHADEPHGLIVVDRFSGVFAKRADDCFDSVNALEGSRLSLDRFLEVTIGDQSAFRGNGDDVDCRTGYRGEDRSELVERIL